MESGGLEAFKAAKEEEIKALKAIGRPALEQSARCEREVFRPPDFLKALEAGAAGRGIAVIAEYKRASPSLGEIELGISPEEAVEAFREADCVSVLTEGKFFKGEIEYLQRMSYKGLPLLRKDFVFSPLQVLDTAARRASALLFIVRVTPGVAELRELLLLAGSLGLASVVEVFDAEDLDIARAAGARIIQVNARDLDTLKVDFLASLRLIESCPPREGEFFIAASGLKDAVDLRIARRAGFRGALIGTALMRGGGLREKLAGFLEGLKPPAPSDAAPDRPPKGRRR
ncbi:MAG: indole-3-glycerol-phosphate synthase [Deltaproteobacteria bacterium]|jgi:indole-3-glycerol phosphate synthase|nr:indole-3-glycerol-phosphate synthase [Deltaproteobacteria bacterium]